MSVHGQVRVAIVVVLLTVLLAGLVRRRHVADCYSFAAYLFAMWWTQVLMLLWPGAFWTPHFYLAKESLLGALKLAVALELAYRVFGLFPGAAARARVLLAPLALLSLISIGRLATWDDYGLAVTARGAELQAWAIWLLAVTGLVAFYYNVPWLYLHRAILFGLVGYLAVWTSLLNLLRTYGLEQAGGVDARAFVSAANGWAYIVLLGWWGVAVWRTEEDVSAATLAMIRERTA